MPDPRRPGDIVEDVEARRGGQCRCQARRACRRSLRPRSPAPRPDVVAVTQPGRRLDEIAFARIDGARGREFGRDDVLAGRMPAPPRGWGRVHHGLVVDVRTMTDAHDGHRHHTFKMSVNDSIVTNTDPPSVNAVQFDASSRPRLDCEFLDGSPHPFRNVNRESANLPTYSPPHEHRVQVRQPGRAKARPLPAG